MIKLKKDIKEHVDVENLKETLKRKYPQFQKLKGDKLIEALKNLKGGKVKPLEEKIKKDKKNFEFTSLIIDNWK